MHLRTSAYGADSLTEVAAHIASYPLSPPLLKDSESLPTRKRKQTQMDDQKVTAAKKTEDAKAKTRQRRAHTRSRAGCSECRSRRIRCGEQRPKCDNCIKGNRACEYPPVKIPLRERRALERAAGEALPWQDSTPWECTPLELSKGAKRPELPSAQALVNQMLISGSATNFKSAVSIDMPLRSQELFHYFYETGPTLGVSPKDHTKDSLAYIITDPEALRSAVLMAGTHFAFNVGSLQGFELTFLHHKIETVRRVRDWVSRQDPKLVAEITKQIVTLAYTETCRGDIMLAETHLSGLYALLKSLGALPSGEQKTLDRELDDRYFLLTSTFVEGMKSVSGAVARTEGLGNNTVTRDSTDVLYHLHKYYTNKGKIGHHLKLKAIRLFPAFFNPPHSGAQLLDIDYRPVIRCLRDTTENLGGDPHNDPFCERKNYFWLQGPSSKLYDSVIMAHLSSIYYGGDNDGSEASTPETSKYLVSWCALTIAAQLYMQEIAVVWGPLRLEIILYSLRILQREITIAMRNSELVEFIYWQSFIGLVGVHAYEKHGDLDSEPSFKVFFQRIIREQSKALRLYTWEDARWVLANVLWPRSDSKDWMMREIWDMAMSDGVSS